MKTLVHANAINVETVQAVSHDVISLYIHLEGIRDALSRRAYVNIGNNVYQLHLS